MTGRCQAEKRPSSDHESVGTKNICGCQYFWKQNHSARIKVCIRVGDVVVCKQRRA